MVYKDCSLLIGTVVVAIAFAASSASAQDTVELSQEEPVENGHCEPLTFDNHEPSGGCHVEAESESTMTFWIHTGMQELSTLTCANHFEARFNEDGHGYVYEQVLDSDNPACNREPCDEGETNLPAGEVAHRNLAWEAQLSEPGAATEEREKLRLAFCIETSASSANEDTVGTNCAVDLVVTEVGHDFEIATPVIDANGNGGAPCINLGGAIEWSGHWISTGPEVIEIHHLNDEAL